MTITPTEFRNNLYKILDQALTSGQTISIKRRGRIIQLVPKSEKSAKKSAKRDLSRMPRHKGVINGSPDDIVSIDWSKEWKPFF